MARYIDADKFKSHLENAMKVMHFIGGVNGVDVGAVITALDMMPTADVEEVVRCKDCVHCEHFYPEKQLGEEAREVYYCGIRKTTVRATDFCCYGERREVCEKD